MGTAAEREQQMGTATEQEPQMGTMRKTNCKWRPPRNNNRKWGRREITTANGERPRNKNRKWGRREITNPTCNALGEQLGSHAALFCTHFDYIKTEILRTVRRISAANWKKFPASLLVIRRFRFRDQLVHALVNPAELLLVFRRQLRFFVEYVIQLGEAFFYCGHVQSHDAVAVWADIGIPRRAAGDRDVGSAKWPLGPGRWAAGGSHQ